MAGADERIALEVVTTADLKGTRQVRDEMSALGKAATQATNEAAESQQRHTLTLEQTRKAVAEAGGDMTKLKEILRGMVAEEDSLAAATGKATAALQKQGATKVLQGPIGPQLGPALPSTPAGGTSYASNRGVNLAEIAAYRIEAERSAVSFDKIPPSARRAGNSMGLMAAAAAAGTGSVSGLGAAAGNVAQEMAAMSSSARVAASAAGIGVLVAGLSVLVALAIEAKKSLSEIPEGKLAGSTASHIANLRTEQQISEQLRLIDERRATLQANAGHGDEKAERAIVDLDAAREATQKRLLEIQGEQHQRSLRAIAIETEAQTTAVGRYNAQLRQFDSERDESVKRGELSQEAADLRRNARKAALDRASNEYVLDLEAQKAEADVALNRNAYESRILSIDNAYRKELTALNERSMYIDDYKTALDDINAKHERAIKLVKDERDVATRHSEATRLSESDDPRLAMAGKLALIEEERKADEDRMSKTEAQNVATEKRRKLEKQTIQEGLQGYATLSAAVKNHSTVVGAMAKAAADAVRLHEIAVKGRSAAISAMIEYSAATAAFATGNFGGGALHLAAAAGYGAAAVAAGVEAAQTVSGGGGGGGNSSRGDSGSSTFRPNDAGGGGGGVTVYLQSVHPLSREVIEQTRYEIDRAGVLKRPLTGAGSGVNWGAGGVQSFAS